MHLNICQIIDIIIDITKIKIKYFQNIQFDIINFFIDGYMDDISSFFFF